MKYAILLMSLAILCSCGKTKTEPQKLTAPEDVAGDPVTLTSFPLAKGHSWTYTVQSQTWDYLATEAITTYEYTATIVHDTVLNGFHIYETSNDGSFLYPLWHSAGRAGMFASFNNKCYYITSYTQADPLAINDSCEQVLQYPATLNTSWTQQFYSISIVRNWVANVKVTTPAGTFNCMKLDVYGGPLGNGAHYIQYFSEKGLIQEVKTFSYSAQNPGRGPRSEIVITQLKSVNF